MRKSRFTEGQLADVVIRFDVQGIAYDRWRIEELKRSLADDGIKVPLTDWGQGFRDMAPAVDALETAVLNGRIRHGGHPVLRWNASNASISMDPAGARKIDKSRSIGRIDGLIALADGGRLGGEVASAAA